MIVSPCREDLTFIAGPRTGARLFSCQSLGENGRKRIGQDRTGALAGRMARRGLLKREISKCSYRVQDFLLEFDQGDLSMEGELLNRSYCALARYVAACSVTASSVRALILGVLVLFVSTTHANEMTERRYDAAELVFSDGNTKYYFLAYSKAGGFVRMAAVHQVSMDQPVIDLVETEGVGGVSRYEVNEQGQIVEVSQKYYVYSPAFIDFVTTKVVNWTVANKGPVWKIEILHFVAEVNLPNISKSASDPEEPLIKTRFARNGNRWEADYGRSIQRALTLSPARQVTATAALAARGQALEAQNDHIAYVRQEAEDRRAKGLANEKEKAAKALKAGYVYRPAVDWGAYNDPIYLRWIFDGNTKNVKTNFYFRYHFNAYAAAYSKHCRHLLPKRVPTYRVERQTYVYNGMGLVVNDYSTTLALVYLKPRLKDKFEKYVNTRPEAGETAHTLVSLLKGQLTSRIESGLNAIADLETFLASEDCGGPTVRQFEENLVRIAYGRPTVQQAGDKVKDAAAETVRPEALENPPTFALACHAYNSFSDSMAQWCSCLDWQYEKVLTADEAKRFRADYAGFSRTHLQVNPAKKGPEFQWRLYEPANACKN